MDSTIILTESDCLSNNLLEILDEQVIKLDPNLKRLLSSKSIRRNTLIKYGKSAFLKPEQMEFPIIHPRTGKVDCHLLYSAYLKAKSWSNNKPGYNEIALKAKELINAISCDSKIRIQLESDTFEIIEFVELF